jgi:hypothetical protein
MYVPWLVEERKVGYVHRFWAEERKFGYVSPLVDEYKLLYSSVPLEEHNLYFLTLMSVQSYVH